MYFQVVERSAGDGSVLASLDCALFASARASVIREFARAGRSFDPREGTVLRMLGRADIWPPSGRLQFVVDSIDPDFQEADGGQILRRLVDGLRARGVLERNSRLEMPGLPLRVGVVTSSGSAALDDFLTTLRESGFPFEVWIVPAPMQGAGTARGVIASLRSLSRLPGLDVVAITRGGGSAADLAWFNSEELGLEISRAPWPVLSGIGHEVDFTLPDFVAHTRAKTPTHAAQILVDRVSDFASDLAALTRMLAVTAVPRVESAGKALESTGSLLSAEVRLACSRRLRQIDRLSAGIGPALERRLSSLSLPLEARAERLTPRSCLRSAASRASEIDRLASTLDPSARRLLSSKAAVLGLLEQAASAGDPSRMFARGWSMVTDEDGRLLKSVGQTSPGAMLTVRVSDGSVKARTEEIQR